MRRSILPVAAAVLLLATCKSGTDPVEEILSLVAHAGNGQTGTAGQAIATNPAVRLTGNGGAAVAGRSVTFEVTGGGGTVTGATQTTDANGVATVGTWTLGTATGANTLRATATGTGINGNPVTFTATANAGPPAEVTKQAGDGQSAVAGQAPATRPAVRVRDQFNNPVAGATVTFAVTGGGGNVTGAQQTTGADGIATVGGWTLGTTVGPNALTATVPGSGITGNPAVFAATGTVGPPGILTKTAGDGQNAAVSTAVAIDPAVKLTDVNNNPIAGATITFAVASGGGTTTLATPVTDAAGVATIGSWTLGPVAGANTLTATAVGTGITGNPATFTATGNALVASAMVKHEGDNQTVIAGQAVLVAPAVRLTAANGDPVPGVAVDFTVTQGGGTTTAPPSLAAGRRSAGTSAIVAQAISDANGVARVNSWTLGPNVGTNALMATATGSNITGNPATFNATGAINPVSLGGNWTGSWNSTTFGTSGSVTMTLTVTASTKTIVILADFNGQVFGIGDPPAETYNATYTPASGGFTTQSNRFGGLTMSVSPVGAVTATALNPAPGISRVDVTGTLTPNSLTTNYIVRFTGGGQAVGTWNMTK